MHCSLDFDSNGDDWQSVGLFVSDYYFDSDSLVVSSWERHYPFTTITSNCIQHYALHVNSTKPGQCNHFQGPSAQSFKH